MKKKETIPIITPADAARADAEAKAHAEAAMVKLAISEHPAKAGRKGK